MDGTSSMSEGAAAVAAGLASGAAGGGLLAALALRCPARRGVPRVGAGLLGVVLSFGLESVMLLLVQHEAQAAIVPFGAGLAAGFLGMVVAGVVIAERRRARFKGDKREG